VILGSDFVAIEAFIALSTMFWLSFAKKGEEVCYCLAEFMVIVTVYKTSFILAV
jgi:hypothetical protein